MAEFKRRDANSTGKYCEMLALLEFTALGYQVALPFGNQAVWDFLIEECGIFRRVQVKAASPTRNNYSVGLLRGKSGSKRTYSIGDVDYIVAVCPENRAIWKMPIEAVAGKQSQALTLASPMLISHDAGLS